MIHIDEIWLATQPLDMRAGPDKALAWVVEVSGSARPNCAFLFANRMKAVIYDFAPDRSGEHARDFLGDWSGKPVCDDYGAYKSSFTQGVAEIGCMAHARRKFFDLQAGGKSQLAAQTLGYIGQLYEIERESKDLEPGQRQRLR